MNKNIPSSSIMELQPNHSSENNCFNNLSNKWTYYAHLPHDTDWSLKSYKTILEAKNLEEWIVINEAIPDIVIRNCMLFIMKDDVKPIWEDIYNKDGGCFSYKISNKNVPEIWKNMVYKLIGNDIIKLNVKNNVNGITISPKKNFCILKIWFKDCLNKDPETINYFKGLSAYGCLFKKHIIR